jgi:hypothetical protein
MRFKLLEITNFGVFSEEQSFKPTTVKNLDCSKPIIILAEKMVQEKQLYLKPLKFAYTEIHLKAREYPNGNTINVISRHIDTRWFKIKIFRNIIIV